MRFGDLIHYIRADLYRYKGARGPIGFARAYFRHHGFRVIVWLRITACLSTYPALRPLYWLALLKHWRCRLKYGVDLPHETSIGPGLYIGHTGGIVVNGQAQIGSNCNLSHGVTIGKLSRGLRQGFPMIGDRVYLGPGAKILGGIQVGNDVVIGANAVVVKDVQHNEVVGGVPAKVISARGSEGYVTWTYCEGVERET